MSAAPKDPSKAESFIAFREKMKTMSPQGKAYAYGALDALKDLEADFNRQQVSANHPDAYLAGWCWANGI